MKIVLTLKEDNYSETEFEMCLEHTEIEDYKWITLNGKKYSVLTESLVKAVVALSATKLIK